MENYYYNKYTDLIIELIKMVNSEKQTKDGFGLPSTDVRKKDNALIEAARIADKIAKWKAEFEKVIPKEVVAVSEKEVADKHNADIKAKELADKLEAERVAKLEAVLKAEKDIADRKAELQAELDDLDAL